MRTEKHVSISSAKTRLLDLLRQVEQEHEHVVLTQGGLPKAVLLNYEEFTGLLETLDILADAETMRGIAAGLQDARVGRLVPLAEALKT